MGKKLLDNNNYDENRNVITDPDNLVYADADSEDYTRKFVARSIDSED